MTYKEDTEKKNVAAVGDTLKRLFFCAHLSCCLEKLFTFLLFYLTYLENLYFSIRLKFMSCYSSEKLSKISPWRWHLWVMELKPLTHVNKLLLSSCDRPGSVADLWFDVVPHRRTNTALQLQLALKGKLQKINFTCKFSLCHWFEIRLSKKY